MEEHAASHNESHQTAESVSKPYMDKVGKLKSDLAKLRTAHEQAILAAETLGPRIAVKESLVALKKNYDILKARIEEHRQLPGFVPEEAEDAYLRRKEKTDFAIDTLNALRLLRKVRPRSLRSPLSRS
jgi:hypothetical protein